MHVSDFLMKFIIK